MSDDNSDTRTEFDETVNVTARELEQWLDTDESKSVGLLKAKKSDLSDGDTRTCAKLSATSNAISRSALQEM